MATAPKKLNESGVGSFTQPHPELACRQPGPSPSRKARLRLTATRYPCTAQPGDFLPFANVFATPRHRQHPHAVQRGAGSPLCAPHPTAPIPTPSPLHLLESLGGSLPFFLPFHSPNPSIHPFLRSLRCPKTPPGGFYAVPSRRAAPPQNKPDSEVGQEDFWLPAGVLKHLPRHL